MTPLFFYFIPSRCAIIPIICSSMWHIVPNHSDNSLFYSISCPLLKFLYTNIFYNLLLPFVQPSLADGKYYPFFIRAVPSLGFKCSQNTPYGLQVGSRPLVYERINWCKRESNILFPGLVLLPALAGKSTCPLPTLEDPGFLLR